MPFVAKRCDRHLKEQESRDIFPVREGTAQSKDLQGDVGAGFGVGQGVVVAG